MKRALAVLCLLAFATAAGAQEVREGTQPKGTIYDRLDNLWFDMGAGCMMPAEEDSTWLFYSTMSYGFPIDEKSGLGGQTSAQVTMRENDPDWTLALGLFQREAPITFQRHLGLQEASWAMQLLYVQTFNNADLFGLKPILGAHVDDDNYLALTGIWGVNDETVDRTPAPDTMQLVNQSMLIWGSRWLGGKLRTEAGAGYAFGTVDEVILGVHTGLQLTDMVSINVTGQADLLGNYYAAVSLGFDLGREAGNSSFNNIAIREGTRYTPFPIEGLPVVFHENDRGEVTGGGFGPGPL